MSMLTQKRIRIRDRLHAKDVAQTLSSWGVFQSLGTADGFADWLYVNRSTFNGANPLQQATVYLNRVRSFAKRGSDFDAFCRDKADKHDEARAMGHAKFDAAVAEVNAWWSETPAGAEISLGIAELFLGRGQAFAQLLDGSVPVVEQPSWVIDWLLDVFNRLEGPDSSLSPYEWTQRYAEDGLERAFKREGKALARIRRLSARGMSPSRVDMVSLASVTLVMSRVLAIRTALRTHLVRAQMADAINDAAPIAVVGTRPLRSSREV